MSQRHGANSGDEDTMIWFATMGKSSQGFNRDISLCFKIYTSNIYIYLQYIHPKKKKNTPNQGQ